MSVVLWILLHCTDGNCKLFSYPINIKYQLNELINMKIFHERQVDTVKSKTLSLKLCVYISSDHILYVSWRTRKSVCANIKAEWFLLSV